MPILSSTIPFSIKSIQGMDFQSFELTVNARVRGARPSAINVRRAWNIMNLASIRSTRGGAIRINSALHGHELCQVVSGTLTAADITTHLGISNASLNSTLSQIKKIFKLITHYDSNVIIPTAARRKMMNIKVRGGCVTLVEFPVLDSHTRYTVHFNHVQGTGIAPVSTVPQYLIPLRATRTTVASTRQTRGRRARASAYQPAQAPRVVAVQKPKFFENPFSGMSSIAVFALQFQANP